MKVQFNRSALMDSLGIITSVVPSRTPKPILKCVRIEAQEACVHLYATDLEVGIGYTLSEVKVLEQGQIVLDAERLAAIVRESTDDVLTLESQETTCEIRGADSHFTIYGQEVEQFPPVSAFAGDADVEVHLEELKTGIRQCLFATARESSRYAINGVLWEMTGKRLSLVATDGRRLAKTSVSLVSAPSAETASRTLIVPAKTMSLLDRLSTSEKNSVMIKLVGSQILFRCGEVMITSNLVEGNFPKYDDIIPKDYDKRIMLPTEGVASAVRRASLLASEETKGIKLSFSDNTLTFSGRAPEAGAAEITMSIDYGGDPISVGFSPQFLTDAFRVMKTDAFEMDLSQPDRPGLIKSGSDFIYVLMPINLA